MLTFEQVSSIVGVRRQARHPSFHSRQVASGAVNGLPSLTVDGSRVGTILGTGG